MAKKKTKNKASAGIETTLDPDAVLVEGISPPDPNVPDLPTPTPVVVDTTHNASGSGNPTPAVAVVINGQGPTAIVAATPKAAPNPSLHLNHHHDHAHHHHHSHYARSVDKAESEGGTKIEKDTKEITVEEILDDGTVKETRTVVEEIREVKQRPVSVAASVRAASVSASIPAAAAVVLPPAPSIQAIPAAVTTTAKAPSVKSPTPILTTLAPHAETAPVPASPAASVRSHRSHRSHRPHHHPEVVVNVTLPPAPATAPVSVPAPAPPAAPTPIFAPPVPPVEEPIAGIPPHTVHPATIALPPSRPTTILVASPAPSVRSMRLPKLPCIKEKNPVVLVQAVPVADEAIVGGADDEVVETKVVTTTTTTLKRAPTPPKVVTPPLTPPSLVPMDPAVPIPTTSLVENVPTNPTPTHLPTPPPTVAPPAAPVLPPATPPVHRQPHENFIERRTVETITYPLKSISKAFKIPRLPKLPMTASTAMTEGEVDVNTAATTIGGATSAGFGGARTAVLTGAGGGVSRTEGTKAGLRPIPYVNYQALLTPTPPPTRRTHLPTPTLQPALTVASSPARSATQRTPPGPKTILTMSAELDRDSKGNEHMHAVLRDHTGVRKVDKVALQTPKGDARTALGLDLNPDPQGVAERVEEVVETKKEKKEREKRERKEEKERLKKEKNEPVYRSLKGILRPPLSERYAAPPALTEIQNAAKERYEKRFQPPGMGMGAGPTNGMAMGMGGYPMGGMRMGGYGQPYMGPYAPTLPQPMTMPQPPLPLASRPPMFSGGFNPYPMPGMGMPLNTNMMGMGMGQMGYGAGMPAWNGMGGWGFMGNPRFPARG